MLSFMEKFTENVKNNPNTAMFFDEINTKGISFGKIDEVSARIYAYLSANGIGKEDFVLINLPRGVQPVVAIVGVWKTGAAFTIVEDNYAPERIEFIRKDCGCKAEINKDTWEEIMNTEPKEGYVQADDHDAAFAIYTSGTTGNPKGVLHEYGNITRIVQSVMISKEETLVKRNEHGALVAPLNFIASMDFIIYVLYCAQELDKAKLYIVSYATIKNPVALKKFMIEKTISFTFLTPSYVRMLGGQTGPFLKTLLVGSEPANDVYVKGVKIVNAYTMSESGFLVSVFVIDKAYEVCPIGKPAFDLKIALLDEDGNEVADGETGELCYENPYFRGYMNLPAETENAIRDGYYHSGDLARKDPDGNLVLLGRNNDMIKINGNRIEPAEIEAAVKEVLGVSWAAAKGFNEANQSYICAYYKDDIELDSEKTRQALVKRLPYYMIPAYFVKVDEIPLKSNGKMDRKALPAPDIKDYVSTYVEPTTDTEKKLCTAFAKVLKLDRVGINDDFYEMGGDSLGAITVVMESGLPGLNVSYIFRGRTAKNIAEIYDEAVAQDDGVSPDERNEESMQKPHLLTSEQKYMFDYQLYTPKSTMYNLFNMMKFDLDVFDMEQLAEAMYNTIKNHPALLTKYTFDKNGEVIQKYDPSLLKEIKVEEVSEFEMDSLKDDLVKPFKLTNSRLYRCRVFKTEKAGYAFFDVHHSLFDGTSFKLFMANIIKSYMGMPLDKDYYYYILDKREREQNTEFYEEARQYFENEYGRYNWSVKPKTDHESRENDFGELLTELEIKNEEMTAIERSFMISRNEFFITAAILSIAFYNKENDIKISWVFNGREDTCSMSSVGLLFRELPVALHLSDSRTLRDLYQDVHEQVQRAIKYSCYPYVDKNPEVVSDDAAYLLYQQDIRDSGGFGDMQIESIDIRQNQMASQTVLDIEILDGEDGLEAMIDYTSSRYKDESMVKFKDLFMKVTHSMVRYTSQHDQTVAGLRKEISSGDNLLKKFVSIFNRKG